MTAPCRVAVVVLGDLGRSPRMQYHALALAEDGADVDLVGYTGRPPDAAVAHHPRIRVHALPAPLRQRVPAPLFLPAALADVPAQALALARLLLVTLPRPDYLLVQTPPAVPTLVVARLVARLRGAKLVVDWHNFAADLLALRLGRRHPAGTATAAIERVFGRGAHAHLCVSEGMRAELTLRRGLADARVLRDRPAKRVGRTPLPERQRLFARLGLEVDPAAPDRPAIVVTSSSWTADEDFALLLEAMRACDAVLAARPDLPDLLFLLTGEGRERRAWEQRMAALGLRRVRTRTLWAPAEDYPLLLGAADLGVSLHRSASGLDLPMKIADMFGAGLPVCALGYGPVIAEMVRPGENGLLFTDAAELAGHITALLDGFPGRTPALDDLRAGVARLAAQGWAEGWAVEARPVFGKAHP
jgi:beta-1,4-mannosyltransferase